MSLTNEQTPQADPVQDASATPRAEPDQTYGLRAEIHAQVVRIRPGDYLALAHLLAQYPDVAPQILMVAAHHLGNATVQRALAANGEGIGRGAPPSAANRAEAMEMFEEVNGPAPARGAPPSAANQAEAMKLFEEVNGPAPAQGAPPSAANQAEAMADFREVNSEPGRGAPPSAANRAEAMKLFEEVNGPAETAAPAKASTWEVRARHYNAAHRELVEEFDAATGGTCRGPDGELDPNAVARWQAAHHVAVDGCVGHQTVAAARKHVEPEVRAAPNQAAAPTDAK